MDLQGDITKPGGIGNPSGGVTSKVYHLRQALPNIEIYSDLSTAGDIVIVEALWFDDASSQEIFEQKLDEYAKLKAFKILWTSDLACLRWPGCYQEQIFDSSDVIGTLSDYSQQLLEFHTNKASKLYDPIDIDMFKPGQKERALFSIGQISLEKNIGKISKIFKSIPQSSQLSKIHIGSRYTWGLDHHEDSSLDLENELIEAVDVIESSLSRIAIARRMSSLWGYVADTLYDFSSYSMMEAMLCGCWLFVGQHLMYGERPSLRFNTVSEAVEQILCQLKNAPPESGIINEEGRQFIIDRNSYDVFRRQFLELIGRVSFGF